MKRQLNFSAAFVRTTKRFLKKRPHLKIQFKRVLGDLSEDAFANHLKTHKLKGALAGRWSTSAAYDLRIIFRIETIGDAEEIVLLAVGTHDDVY